MPEFVKIPLGQLRKLEEAYRNVIENAVIVSDSPDERHNVVWIDPQNGHDSNDGSTAATAVNSWERVFDLLVPGTLVMLRPGVYRRSISLFHLISPKEKPIYFKAEILGTAIFDNYLQGPDHEWTLHGSNVYKRPNRVRDSGPWCGFAKDRLLPGYNSLYDLLGSKLSGVIRKPKYGFAQEDGMLYVRLPGNGDPRKEPTYLTADTGTDFISINGCSYVIFEGIRFRGHGNGHAINCTSDCHHIWVQNCISEHGRYGFNVSKDSSLVNCYFRQPGLRELATDFHQINQGDKTAFSTYAERYRGGSYDEFADELYLESCGIENGDMEFSEETPDFWKL